MQIPALIGLTPKRDAVWAYSGSGTSWTQIGGAASQIYAGSSTGDTYLVATSPSTGDLLLYSGTPMQWKQIGGPGAAFAVIPDSAVVGLTPNRDGVFVYDGSGTSWTQIGGPASQIVATHAMPLIQ
jgi:hypothetical protein